MQVVSSVIAWNLPQADGTVNVREQHVDSEGLVYNIDYNTSPSTDLSARLAASAAKINANLVQKAAYLAANPGALNGAS